MPMKEMTPEEVAKRFYVLEEEIRDRAETEASLVDWNEKLAKEVEAYKIVIDKLGMSMLRDDERLDEVVALLDRANKEIERLRKS